MYKTQFYLVVKIHDRAVLGLSPSRVKNFFPYAMDLVGQPHKWLGADASYHVMINVPMKYLTLNRLQKSNGQMSKPQLKKAF